MLGRDASRVKPKEMRTMAESIWRKRNCLVILRSVHLLVFCNRVFAQLTACWVVTFSDLVTCEIVAKFFADIQGILPSIFA